MSRFQRRQNREKKCNIGGGRGVGRLGGFEKRSSCAYNHDATTDSKWILIK